MLSTDQKNSEWHPIVQFAYNIIELIYSEVLDYKTLIDSNWHYLYNPKTEWGKFSKIVVFLYTVKNYIENEASNLDEKREGYYTDLKNELANKTFNATVIATTNYSSFIEKLLGKAILFLNGGTDIYYDPYMNSIDKNNEGNHITVPLLFTQSGTKPMTSIDMSEKYVSFYHRLKKSDFICSIGFGFNPDDEHINGIIRTLIERDDKKLFIVDTNSISTEREKRKKMTEKLKISKEKNLRFITVNSKSRKCNSGKIWYEEII